MKTRADCVREEGSVYLVNKRVERGDLYKLEKGVYSETKDVPELAVLSFKYPHAVVTMRTALYLYEIIDKMPEVYDFATGRDAAKIQDKRIKQFFVPAEICHEGVTEKDYNGYPVRIYNKERLLVEVLRYRTKMPHLEYKKIVLRYRKLMPFLDVNKVFSYIKAAPKSQKLLDVFSIEIL